MDDLSSASRRMYVDRLSWNDGSPPLLSVFPVSWVLSHPRVYFMWVHRVWIKLLFVKCLVLLFFILFLGWYRTSCEGRAPRGQRPQPAQYSGHHHCELLISPPSAHQPNFFASVLFCPFSCLHLTSLSPLHLYFFCTSYLGCFVNPRSLCVVVNLVILPSGMLCLVSIYFVVIFCFVHPIQMQKIQLNQETQTWKNFDH